MERINRIKVTLKTVIKSFSDQCFDPINTRKQKISKMTEQYLTKVFCFWVVAANHCALF